MSNDMLVDKYQRYFQDPVQNILKKGMVGVACNNVRRALQMLNVKINNLDSDQFDSDLHIAVEKFQKREKHRVVDGIVGPGTRTLLTKLLLAHFQPDIFMRLQDPFEYLYPLVFISYAWEDTETVNKIDQWLRDHGVTVIRDKNWFSAGEQIPESIRRAVILADKVIAVYSANSKGRDWPRLEISITENLEKRLGYPVLIYLKLDDIPLPKHDPNRLAILAKGRILLEVGNELLHSIKEIKIKPKTYFYNPDEIL